jgi:hypothetical protein
LQINPVADWNVAIPLLSPLVSPDRPVETKSREDSRLLHLHHHQQKQMKPDLPRHQAAEAEMSSSSSASVVFKKWQHPAAPFCYEPAPPVRPFVPV